jgi:hypothetical protein
MNIHFISRLLHSTDKINWFCHAFTLERWTQTSLRAKYHLNLVYSRKSTGWIWLIISSLDQSQSQQQPHQGLTYLPKHSTCKWCQSYFLDQLGKIKMYVAPLCLFHHIFINYKQWPAISTRTSYLDRLQASSSPTWLWFTCKGSQDFQFIVHIVSINVSC